jgi:malonyl CoA-acyl carrier protein transacylase
LTQHKKSAFIFPAFINEYPENPFSGFQELQDRFQDLLMEASSLVDPDLAGFDFISNHFLWDELKTQYLTYIYSCAVTEVLDKKRLIPAYSAGYSMGIYAALVHAKVVTFDDGLLLIKKAYETIREIVQDKKYGMCSIIGLSREDINSLIDSQNLHVQITNQNSSFTFVISGLYEDIMSLLKTATDEGALHTHLLNVSLPYHSDYLRETKPAFSDFIKKIRFANPQTKILSLIDQQIPEDPADIIEEVINNLFTPLNWYQTQSELLRFGVNLFVECGLGKNLMKNSKFIEGEFKFYSVCDYIKKLNTEYTDFIIR